MYSQKQLSLRAVRFHLALIGMRQRRLIGEYRFQYIDLDEAARHVGSDHAKANSQALRDLQAKGVWYQSDEGIWYPATDVDQLRIETQELRALRGWLASLTGRRFIVVPRLLFEALPRLSASQIALNLELLTCCTWTGDKHETIASKPVSLRLHRVAERWGMSYHTIQERLNNGNVSLGPHVRLTLDDNPPDWYLKEHGRRFLVTISKPATPSRKTRKAARQTLHKCSLSKEGQKNPTPQGQKEHENPTPLILGFSPLLQRDLTLKCCANQLSTPLPAAYHAAHKASDIR
jgi:hypothetical protein